MSGPQPSKQETIEIVARVSVSGAERLDQVAARRGIERDELIADAVDEYLAREGLSGRFIDSLPPMLLPWRDRDRSRDHRGRRRQRHA